MRTKTDTTSLSNAFGALAELPEVVEDLRQRIAELESRLTTPPANDTLLDTAGAAKLLAMTPEAVSARLPTAALSLACEWAADSVPAV